jgi:CRISPR/Cas system CMR-associated protein Cmr5 small subunit
MHIRAFYISEKENWKHTSMIAFNVARFGNSDPKTFPKSIKEYMPELWKDEVEEDEDELIQAARQWRLQKYLNSSGAA